MKKLTSHQYLQLVSNLPNPLSYQYGNNKDKNTMLQVAILVDNHSELINITNLNSGNSVSYISDPLFVKFKLNTRKNVWFWEPMEEITIIKAEENEY